MEKTKREIKFRTWNSSQDKMFYYDPKFSRYNSDDGSCDVPLCVLVGDDINTVMQYTGLKDKNGKEIYEGDIYRDDLGAIFLVEWKAREDGEYSNFYAGFDFVYGIHDIEVIGNIYENPNLLSSTNER